MKDGADYQRAHRVVREVKGPASSHVCSDCGDRQAQDWAFRGDGGLVDPICGKIYSNEPDDYTPVCRSCHMRSDGRDKIGAMNFQTFNTSPVYREQKSAIGKAVSARTNAMRRRCLNCGVIYHPGGMGVHQKATGHVGYEIIERGTR